MKKIKIIGDNWFTMLLGTAIMAVAIKWIYDPVNLVTGGVSGAGIIVKELAGVPLWLTNLVFNIPLFLAALLVKGWRFIRRTLVATLGLSFFLYILPDLYINLDDILFGPRTTASAFPKPQAEPHVLLKHGHNKRSGAVG